MISYLTIGFIWLLLHEIVFATQSDDGPKQEFTNGWRIRLFLFWPITLIAWIIGFVEAWRNSENT